MNVFLDKSGLEHLCKLFMERYCDKKQADELYLRKDGKAKKAETADKVAHALTINGKAYDGSKAVTVEVKGGSPFENNALKFPNGGLLEIVKAGESGGQEDPSHGGETGGDEPTEVFWSKTFPELREGGDGLPYTGTYRVTSPDGVVKNYTLQRGGAIFKKAKIDKTRTGFYYRITVDGKTILYEKHKTLGNPTPFIDIEEAEETIGKDYLKKGKIECIKKDE